MSQFLVEICAGRSAEQLSDALSGSLTDLDLAAMRVLELRTAQPARSAKRDARQLALFEKTAGKRTVDGKERTAPSVGYGRA